MFIWLKADQSYGLVLKELHIFMWSSRGGIIVTMKQGIVVRKSVSFAPTASTSNFFNYLSPASLRAQHTRDVDSNTKDVQTSNTYNICRNTNIFFSF